MRGRGPDAVQPVRGRADNEADPPIPDSRGRGITSVFGNGDGGVPLAMAPTPGLGQKKSPQPQVEDAGISKNIPGSDLLSHQVALAVPSALRGLTSVFGMGTGVSPSLWPPEFLFQLQKT